MVCTSGTVDILHIVVFVSINNLTTLGHIACLVSCVPQVQLIYCQSYYLYLSILCISVTVDILSVILLHLPILRVLLVSMWCISATANKLTVIVFVPTNIVSTLG